MAQQMNQNQSNVQEAEFCIGDLVRKVYKNTSKRGLGRVVGVEVDLKGKTETRVKVQWLRKMEVEALKREYIESVGGAPTAGPNGDGEATPAYLNDPRQCAIVPVQGGDDDESPSSSTDGGDSTTRADSEEQIEGEEQLTKKQQKKALKERRRQEKLAEQAKAKAALEEVSGKDGSRRPKRTVFQTLKRPFEAEFWRMTFNGAIKFYDPAKLVRVVDEEAALFGFSAAGDAAEGAHMVGAPMMLCNGGNGDSNVRAAGPVVAALSDAEEGSSEEAASEGNNQEESAAKY